MKRAFDGLGDREFDVLVIGAGIFGACIARELTLDGRSVALIDRGDFGGGASANSLKIIHGGLRHVQRLDVGAMRRGAAEKRAWLRMAPHLVRPLRCLIPTYGRGAHSRTALGAATWLYERIAGDSKADHALGLPPARVLSRAECLDAVPGFAEVPGLSGAVAWTDGQVLNTERLTLAMVRSAAEAGAVVANYAEAESLLTRSGRVVGAQVGDGIGGNRFEVRSRLVVDASGASAMRLLNRSGFVACECVRPPALVKAWNLVTRPLDLPCALGVPLREVGTLRPRGRMLFLTPWNGCTIIGTLYAHAGESLEEVVSDSEAQRLLDELNRAYSPARLTLADVTFRHVGHLPAEMDAGFDAADSLLGADRIMDHGREHGVAGLVTVLGTKYTTARDAAARVSVLVSEHLGRSNGRTAGHPPPVDGGDLSDPRAFAASLRRRAPAAFVPHLERLVCHYGTRAREIITRCRENAWESATLSEGTSVLRAEVQYALEQEAAVRLADVVLRRTDLGTKGPPDDEAFRACAGMMAERLGWNPARTQSELTAVRQLYAGQGRSGASPGDGDGRMPDDGHGPTPARNRAGTCFSMGDT